ncbi:MAG: murein L,D-transpeptidase catalytic domain family protein [Flavobacterium sp.]
MTLKKLVSKSISTIFVFSLFAFTPLNSHIIKKRTNSISKAKKNESGMDFIYTNLNPNNFELPQKESFAIALEGFFNLKSQGLIHKDILTIIDFSLSSKDKRLWVIDLTKNIVLFHSLVAHGKNSGEEFANDFSNQRDSHKSSLGFYLTGETYKGKHGLSLKLDGIEKGLNDNARTRGVVVHASDYVSEEYVQKTNRLGRSQGCPALPKNLSANIINIIKNKSCLFIYHPSLQSKNTDQLVCIK